MLELAHMVYCVVFLAFTPLYEFQCVLGVFMTNTFLKPQNIYYKNIY